MQNRVNVKLWNLAALLLPVGLILIMVPKSLPFTTSPPASIAAEQDEADISMEGIPVYGTVSIVIIDNREPLLGGATEHSLKVGKGGVTRTGWLAHTGNFVLRDTADEHSDATSIDLMN
ncbi:hypothetical protein ABU162_05680 [Paenibacillus thiaminolyticus]|uniref:hypothetical protein n=1 Tax=Paenibacillus thiaminolyticus TaxID=49283 RepID=UPI0035A6771F